jgi:hypothetical protein
LVQQISTSMQVPPKETGTVDEIAQQCRTLMSRAKQSTDMTHRLDLWSFLPFYPYVPSDRRWGIGMEAGGSSCPGKFTLLVHTTHADSRYGRSCINSHSHPSDHTGSQEQLVLSSSAARPVYRVMFWYSNPFHFLTGWSEASISTGLPSQPDKMYGGERPMWLVSGHTRSSMRILASLPYSRWISC